MQEIRKINHKVKYTHTSLRYSVNTIYTDILRSKVKATVFKMYLKMYRRDEKVLLHPILKQILTWVDSNQPEIDLNYLLIWIDSIQHALIPTSLESRVEAELDKLQNSIE